MNKKQVIRIGNRNWCLRSTELTMNKEQIETIKWGIMQLIVIAKLNNEFTRELLKEMTEIYDNLEGDEYKYLYVKAIQVDKMLALGLNAKEMLENDLKSWEKWEREVNA